MTLAVVQGATCVCSFGTSPSVFVPHMPPRVMFENLPVGSTADNKPEMNFTPPAVSCFGMCTSMANPEVQAATSAALGVLTPMPCKPQIVAPWVPGSPKVLVGGAPVLTANSKLMCNYGGIINILNPGQHQVMVG